MARRVSDMVKMYSHGQPRNMPEKPVARKWPPVETGAHKPPPVSPKPMSLTNQSNGGGAFGRSPHAPTPFGAGDDNVPQWKKDMHNRNRTDSAGSGPKPFVKFGGDSHDNTPSWKKPADAGVPAWKQKLAEKQEDKQENIPPWKQRLNKAQEEEKGGATSENIPPWKARQSANENNAPSWRKPAVNSESKPNPPWGPKPSKPEPTSKPSSLWSERNKNTDTAPKFGGYQASNAPAPPPNKPSFNRYSGGEDQGHGLAPTRNGPQSRPFAHSSPTKPSIERTSGSFGNAPQRQPSTSSSDGSGVGGKGSPMQRSSFLHTKPPAAAKNSYNAYPPRTPTPPRGASPRMNGTPPRLPLPNDVFSRPPPLKTSKPPNVVLPPGGKKNSPLPPPPISVAPPADNMSRPLPSPSRGLPPPPAAMRDLPPHPNLAPSLPDRMLPPSPGGARGLPRSPSFGRKASPLPPTPMEADDIYDDPGDEPPPLPPMTSAPPPLLKRESSGMIPTWEDEDDGEALYDETPDEPMRPPQVPAGFPMPGAAPIIPQAGEDTYEDPEAEAYMRLKKMQAAESASNDKKDKKKKDTDKKEKDIRKKFKIKGDIAVEGHGVVKENCRGGRGKDLGVSAGENIEIIRMNDNPKGKWLIRNLEGSYGYVDSDKVTINIADLRSQFGVGSKGPGNASVPPIPTDDDEAIYDQTADEELYEEL